MLKVDQLNKWFGHQQVLHNISFEIKPGHILGLIGANGAGKTTIMKTILGISSYSGHITLGEAPITVADHTSLEKVGALIEYPGLYPYLTGREQLLLFANGSDRQAKVAETIAGLGLASFADVKTKHYSLGMRQKIGIALAFVNQPELVILDEPMNGLDPEATMVLRAFIVQKRAQGVSFLISSHILSELQKVADDVVIIEHGHVVANTSMAALLANNQRFLVIQTDQDALAQRLFKQHGYDVRSADKGLKITLTSVSSINAMLKLVWDQGLVIKRITETQGDLESSLANVLKKSQSETEVF